MRSRRYFHPAALALILALVLSVPTAAQFATDSTRSPAPFYTDDASPGRPGSDSYYATRPIDSIKTQKPTAALFKSMLVPGWGQLGNRKYIKAGVIIAAETALIGAIIHYAGKASEAKRDFENLTDTTLRAKYFRRYDNARGQRNDFSWATGVVIFISMFDAYVDAHMARFPKQREGLALEIRPGHDRFLAAGLSYRF